MEDNLLICRAADTYVGFRVKSVQEVVLAAAVEPVPEAPRELLGLLNYHSELVPVVSLEFLTHNEKDPFIQTSDQFVIIRLPDNKAGSRLAGVLVNNTVGIFGTAEECINQVRWEQPSDKPLRWPLSILLDEQVIHLPEPTEVLTPDARQAFLSYLDRMSG